MYMCVNHVWTQQQISLGFFPLCMTSGFGISVTGIKFTAYSDINSSSRCLHSFMTRLSLCTVAHWVGLSPHSSRGFGLNPSPADCQSVVSYVLAMFVWNKPSCGLTMLREVNPALSLSLLNGLRNNFGNSFSEETLSCEHSTTLENS